VVQLDEIEFPSQLRRTQKFRTEIEAETEFPQFLKTYFEFNNVILGNRIVLRLGLFQTRLITDTSSNESEEKQINSNYLFKNSSLKGSASLTFTTHVIETLREHKYADYNLVLFHPEKENENNGHVYFKLQLRSQSLDVKIYDNNKQIEECYYDPFENDPNVIREKLKQVIILNEDKQFKMDKVIKERDELNRKLHLLAMDEKNIKKEILKLEEENGILNRNITRIQNYDEIHIEIDILGQSTHGVAILEKKYAILLSQLAIQNERHMMLEHEYQQIDPLISKIKMIKDKNEFVKNANEELKFNHKRHEDMLPLITLYQEKIKNNENLIQNLRENVKQLIDKNNLKDGNKAEDIDEKIAQLYKERKKIEEKTLQMNLYTDMFDKEKYDFNNKTKKEDVIKDYQNPDEPFERIIGNDPLMNGLKEEREKFWLEQFRKKSGELEKEVNNLTMRLEKINNEEKSKKEKYILIDPQIKLKKNEMLTRLDAAQSRETVLVEEVIKNFYYKLSSWRIHIIFLKILYEKCMRGYNKLTSLFKKK
jgi:hypothetical protein